MREQGKKILAIPLNEFVSTPVDNHNAQAKRSVFKEETGVWNDFFF